MRKQMKHLQSCVKESWQQIECVHGCLSLSLTICAADWSPSAIALSLQEEQFLRCDPCFVASDF